MSPRELPEWIGSSPDASVPPRVRLRIFERYDGRCQCGCNRKIAAGEAWQADDRIALINGGHRRESNLWPFLVEHHKAKTREDVAEKAKTYAVRSKHLGIKPRQSRPMPGSKRSGIRIRMDGTVERRQ